MVSRAQPRGREAVSGCPPRLVCFRVQRGRRGGRGRGRSRPHACRGVCLVLRCSPCVPDRPAQHRGQGRAHPGRRPHHPGGSASAAGPALCLSRKSRPVPTSSRGTSGGWADVGRGEPSSGQRRAPGGGGLSGWEGAAGSPARHRSTGRRRLGRAPRDRRGTGTRTLLFQVSRKG